MLKEKVYTLSNLIICSHCVVKGLCNIFNSILLDVLSHKVILYMKIAKFKPNIKILFYYLQLLL